MFGPMSRLSKVLFVALVSVFSSTTAFGDIPSPGFTADGLTGGNIPRQTWNQGFDHPFKAGDLDGDGLDDLLTTRIAYPVSEALEESVESGPVGRTLEENSMGWDGFVYGNWDPRTELVVTSLSTGAAVEIWSTEVADTDQLLLMDATGDGLKDVVLLDSKWNPLMTLDRRLRVLSGKNGAVVWQRDWLQSEVPPIAFEVKAIPDADGDNVGDLLMGGVYLISPNGGGVTTIVSGATGKNFFHQAVDGEFMFPVTDVTGDGSSDLLRANARTGLMALVSPRTGQVLWERPRPVDGAFFGLGLRGGVSRYVVFATESSTEWSPQGGYGPYLMSGWLAVMDSATGEVLWRSPRRYGETRIIPDVTGDGVSDLLQIEDQTLTAWGGISGGSVWRVEFDLWEQVSYAGEAGDINGDGRSDFLINLRSGPLIINGATGATLWTSYGWPGSPALIDADGDGSDDFFTLSGGVASVHSGRDLSLIWSGSYPASGCCDEVVPGKFIAAGRIQIAIKLTNGEVHLITPSS